MVFFQSVMLFLNYLKSNNLLGAWAFFGLADFEFNSLAIAQCGVIATGLNLSMMNKQILAAIIRGNKTEALLCAKPLYCTFSHAIYSILFW